MKSSAHENNVWIKNREKEDLMLQVAWLGSQGITKETLTTQSNTNEPGLSQINSGTWLRILKTVSGKEMVLSFTRHYWCQLF